MLDHYDLGGDDVIFFEHNPEAVESAESVGIKTFYYDPIKRDITLLQDFITTNL